MNSEFDSKGDDMNKVPTVDARARSRRDFFASAGAVLATAGVVGSLQAQSSGNGDIDILNFALRLERLESTFYQQGLARFAATDFANANFAKNFTATQVTNAYSYIQAIGAHEMTHVMQLSATITQLGGTLAPTDCYGFQPYGGDVQTFRSADSFLATAMLLENTGVGAYDGAIAQISAPNLRTAAATIATVEARHAGYLNLLNGVIPFPSAFDPTASASDILTAATRFIASCSAFPPNAVAGPKGTGTGVGSFVTTSMKTGFRLDATKSAAADGSAPTMYLWETVLGSNATVQDGNSPTPTVTFNGGPGIYAFSLTVGDRFGTNSTDTLKVNYTGV